MISSDLQTYSGFILQITALSHALRNKIEVIQADGPSIIVGDEYTNEPITLT